MTPDDPECAAFLRAFSSAWTGAEREEPSTDDALMRSVPVDLVFRFYGRRPPPWMPKEEWETTCSLSCDTARKRKVPVLVIGLLGTKRWRCRMPGCGAGGDLLTLCDHLKNEPPRAATLTPERRASLRADLSAIRRSYHAVSGVRVALPSQCGLPDSFRRAAHCVLRPGSQNEMHYEDVISEAFAYLTVWLANLAAGGRRPHEEFESALFQWVISAFQAGVRNAHRRVIYHREATLSGLSLPPDAAPAKGSEQEAREIEMDIRSCVSRLTGEHRRTVQALLSLGGDPTLEQLGRALNVSVSEAHRRRHAAYDYLRRLFASGEEP